MKRYILFCLATGLLYCGIILEVGAKPNEEQTKPKFEFVWQEEIDKKVDKLIKIGNIKANKKDYKGAISDYSKAIKIDPNRSGLYLQRGIFRRKLGDHRGAVIDFTFGIEINESKPLSKDTSKSIKILNTLLGVEYAKFYIQRGISLSELGDNRGAVVDFTKAIKLDSKAYLAFFERAFALSKLGDNRSAITDLDKVIKLKPDLAAAFFLRALLNEKSGYIQQAMQDFKRAANLFKKQNETSRYELALKNIKRLSNKSQSNTAIVKRSSSSNIVSVTSYTKTSITVAPGDEIRFEAVGSVRFGFLAGSGGPNGISYSTRYNYFKNLPHGYLLARVKQERMKDFDGWFPVGTDKNIIVKKSGLIEFLVNDSDPHNNSGAFKVKVTVSSSR